MDGKNFLMSVLSTHVYRFCFGWSSIHCRFSYSILRSVLWSRLASLNGPRPFIGQWLCGDILAYSIGSTTRTSARMQIESKRLCIEMWRGFPPSMMSNSIILPGVNASDMSRACTRDAHSSACSRSSSARPERRSRFVRDSSRTASRQFCQETTLSNIWPILFILVFPFVSFPHRVRSINVFRRDYLAALS